MALVKDNEREELAAAYACFLLHDAGVEVSVCASFLFFPLSPRFPFSPFPADVSPFHCSTTSLSRAAPSPTLLARPRNAPSHLRSLRLSTG